MGIWNVKFMSPGSCDPSLNQLVIVDKGFFIEIAMSSNKGVTAKNRFEPVVTLSRVQNYAVLLSVLVFKTDDPNH